MAGPEAGWQLTVDGRPEEPDAVAAAVTGGGGSGGGDGGEEANAAGKERKPRKVGRRPHWTPLPLPPASISSRTKAKDRLSSLTTQREVRHEDKSYTKRSHTRSE